MPTPTAEQIQAVQTNLQNMQGLNNRVFDHAQPKITNAYLLLNIKDKVDPGRAAALTVFQGAFTAVGAVGGPVGGAAKFLSGLVARAAETASLDLNAQFADYFTHFEAMSRNVGQQLATYYQDVPGNWNTSVTVDGETMRLSDLATAQVPAETNPEFFKLLDAALLGLERQMWTQMMVSNMVITTWTGGLDLSTEGPRDAPPITWVQEYYSAHPAYYLTWTWQEGSWPFSRDTWSMKCYNIGTGAGSLGDDGSLNASACAYLFRDSTPGTVINPNGLFNRADVFTKLGIRTAAKILPDSPFDTGRGML